MTTRRGFRILSTARRDAGFPVEGHCFPWNADFCCPPAGNFCFHPYLYIRANKV